MTRPGVLWQVEWLELHHERSQERRYKNPAACARQLAAILAAPDEIAVLKGVWRTDGFDNDRLTWTPLNPWEVVAEAGVTADSDLDAPSLTPTEWHDRIAAAWRGHNREEAPL